MTAATIAERRAATEAHLATLRGQRGIATLDGLDFDHAALAALEGELEALTEAEGEEVRRDRLKVLRAEGERLTALRSKLSVVEGQRLDAIDRAEKAARELAEALADIFRQSREVATLMRALGLKNSNTLDDGVVQDRFSRYVATALTPATGARRRLGQISLPEAQPRFGGPWRLAEAEACDPLISIALKEPSIL